MTHGNQYVAVQQLTDSNIFLVHKYEYPQPISMIIRSQQCIGK